MRATRALLLLIVFSLLLSGLTFSPTVGWETSSDSRPIQFYARIGGNGFEEEGAEEPACHGETLEEVEADSSGLGSGDE